MVSVMRRRVFHETFKRDAVEQATTSGLSNSAVAAKLGIHETVLRRWVHEFPTSQEAGSSDGKPSTPTSFGPPNANLLAENGLLRREIQRLRADREILKKALAMVFEEMTH
jgi:transposase